MKNGSDICKISEVMIMLYTFLVFCLWTVEQLFLQYILNISWIYYEWNHGMEVLRAKYHLSMKGMAVMYCLLKK